MRAEAPRHRHVVLHRPVAPLGADRDLYVSGDRRRPGAALDDRADPLELLVGRRAHGELAAGPLGHDVRCLAPLGDETVYTDAVAHVDALAVDATEGLHARGERARAVPRSERRVRGSAEEDHL